MRTEQQYEFSAKVTMISFLMIILSIVYLAVTQTQTDTDTISSVQECETIHDVHSNYTYINK